MPARRATQAECLPLNAPSIDARARNVPRTGRQSSCSWHLKYMFALLSENGPCTVAADGVNTTPNPHSWTTNANVIWVDQPIGTGFSLGATEDFDTSATEAGVHLRDFLQEWFKEHPKFAHHKFFITGESYAGHYVPALATALLKSTPTDIPINLQGITIGNGWTTPSHR
ncbi:Aste57867_11523 [Aphanomyces stellatus]|uniref:Carboxypeptidase n=1 Tax=Aphanomyces stellatus TaxID=120398 RepID=A0A485KTA1_9STRA|nr:hypothetical protein As57867_011480 [Aphanomyces stellatus]VFT88384.1 Aste57867_11523 [Aphanomyces stellatus]